MGWSYFYFLKKSHTVFHSDGTDLQSHKQCKGFFKNKMRVFEDKGEGYLTHHTVVPSGGIPSGGGDRPESLWLQLCPLSPVCLGPLGMGGMRWEQATSSLTS